MSLETILPYTICTITNEFNSNFKNYFGYKKPDGNFYSIIRGENIKIEDDIKEKFELFSDKEYRENSLITTLESKTDVRFEFKKLPKYKKEHPLFLLMYREKLKVNYNIIYCIGYMSIHDNYWTIYTDDLYEWITFHSKDIIAWYKLPNEFKETIRYEHKLNSID
jgi:hypothetical protein